MHPVEQRRIPGRRSEKSKYFFLEASMCYECVPQVVAVDVPPFGGDFPIVTGVDHKQRYRITTGYVAIRCGATIQLIVDPDIEKAQ